MYSESFFLYSLPPYYMGQTPLNNWKGENWQKTKNDNWVLVFKLMVNIINFIETDKNT